MCQSESRAIGCSLRVLAGKLLQVVDTIRNPFPAVQPQYRHNGVGG